MFPYIEPNLSIRTYSLCNSLMDNYNLALDNTVNEYKNQWMRFWNPSLPVDEMQAQLDFLAGTTTTDLGVSVDALTAYFAKAERLLIFLLNEAPTQFTSCPVDSQGRMLPDFPTYAYQQYMTSGWIYTIDGDTGRMIVSEPCTWAS